MEKPEFDSSKPFQVVQNDAKPAFDPSKPFEKIKSNSDKEPMSSGNAALVKGEEGMMLGLRPVVAGVGAAGANLYQRATGEPTQDSPLGAFVKGRADANQEQNQAQQEHPYISTAANLGGSLVTLPLFPAKGLAGAFKLGAGLGAAQAAGSADSLKDAAVDVAGGAAIGGAASGISKAVPWAANKALDSKAGSILISKVEQVFGKQNPINEHLVGALEDYKSQFQFPENSAVEKQLDGLIGRIQKTPPSKFSQADVEAITQRLGPNAIHDSLGSGAKRLNDVLQTIKSDTGSAISDFLDNHGSAIKKAGGLAGGFIGNKIFPGGGGALGGMAAGDAALSPDTIKLAGSVISSAPRLAGKLADAFGINPTTSEGLTKLMQTPEAKDMILDSLLRDKTAPPPAAQFSTTIKTRSQLGK